MSRVGEIADGKDGDLINKVSRRVTGMGVISSGIGIDEKLQIV